jgi:hypothetical protein
VSWVSDVLSAVHRVVLLEDRVARLDASVEGLTAKVSDTRDRVIRLEGLIEGALRSRRSATSLPPPQTD